MFEEWKWKSYAIGGDMVKEIKAKNTSQMKRALIPRRLGHLQGEPLQDSPEWEQKSQVFKVATAQVSSQVTPVKPV